MLDRLKRFWKWLIAPFEAIDAFLMRCPYAYKCKLYREGSECDVDGRDQRCDIAKDYPKGE